MKSFRKILSVVLSVIAAACLIGAIAIAVRAAVDDLRSREDTDRLRADAAAVLEEPPSPTPLESPEPDPTPEPDPAPEPDPSPTLGPPPEPAPGATPEPVPNPYRDSFLANSDMAAWLQVPGTEIDYPVMWTPSDEEYYLRRGFDRAKNRNGCLILDTESCVDPLTTNLIIHGHNMKSGAMFGTLKKYEEEAFCQEHGEIILYTKNCRRNYQVIAVFFSQVYKKSDQVFKFYKFFQADTEDEFNDFYENIMSLSLYDTGVTAEFGDCFITLSTCSYHVDKGRFVVVAKEVESGETYLPLGE